MNDTSHAPTPTARTHQPLSQPRRWPKDLDSNPFVPTEACALGNHAYALCRAILAVAWEVRSLRVQAATDQPNHTETVAQLERLSTSLDSTIGRFNHLNDRFNAHLDIEHLGKKR